MIYVVSKEVFLLSLPDYLRSTLHKLLKTVMANASTREAGLRYASEFFPCQTTCDPRCTSFSRQSWPMLPPERLVSGMPQNSFLARLLAIHAAQASQDSHGQCFHPRGWSQVYLNILKGLSHETKNGNI